MAYTWVYCKRNDLISVPPGKFLAEDDICLPSEGKREWLLELVDEIRQGDVQVYFARTTKTFPSSV